MFLGKIKCNLCWKQCCEGADSIYLTPACGHVFCRACAYKSWSEENSCIACGAMLSTSSDEVSTDPDVGFHSLIEIPYVDPDSSNTAQICRGAIWRNPQDCIIWAREALYFETVLIHQLTQEVERSEHFRRADQTEIKSKEEKMNRALTDLREDLKLANLRGDKLKKVLESKSILVEKLEQENLQAKRQLRNLEDIYARKRKPLVSMRPFHAQSNSLQPSMHSLSRSSSISRSNRDAEDTRCLGTKRVEDTYTTNCGLENERMAMANKRQCNINNNRSINYNNRNNETSTVGKNIEKERFFRSHE